MFMTKTYQILKKFIAKADSESASASKGNSPSHAVDIKMIDTAPFTLNMKKGNKIFAIFIWQIEKALNPELKLSKLNIKVILPFKYHDLIDVFFKQTANELFLHWLYDHKIVLESEQKLEYTPLYNMSHEKLIAVKNYIEDNLQKDFIEVSQSSVASSILFI